jgi:ribosome-associated heat shock protein Hsp15
MTEMKTRLDKWLWAARFYKTRSAATEAVVGGKVEINGDGAKPAHPIKVGDTIRIRLAPYEHTVVVTGLADRRGSATVAATLYRETEESRVLRERQQELLKIAPGFEFESGKPSKKDRRALEKFRGKR